MTQEYEQPSEDIKALLGRATEIKAALEAAGLEREGLAELKASFSDIKTQISDLQKVENERAVEDERKAILRDLEELKDSTRRQSKADLVGRAIPSRGEPEGSFFSTLAAARSSTIAGSIEAQQKAQLALGEMGSYWMAPDPESKATVGDTNAAGGYLVPVVPSRQINLQATAGRAVVDLFTVISGVVGSGVPVPFEDANSTYSRAVVAGAGTLKENSNFITNSYTATLYTLARIFDVGNQLLRNSQGAAEQLVTNALSRAFALGEDYYAIQGSGSSQPYGLLTALGTSGTYYTTFSSPSASTIAGNWATAVASMAGSVAQRGAVPDAVVLNSGDYWTLISAGDNTGGFRVDPNNGGFGFDAAPTGVTAAGPWGLRLRHTPNMPTDSAVVGEYASALFFRGQSYRVDVSSEAGTRWDYNLTGFRGEEEIAFDARPAVYTGHFQRVNNILP